MGLPQDIVNLFVLIKCVKFNEIGIKLTTPQHQQVTLKSYQSFFTVVLLHQTPSIPHVMDHILLARVSLLDA